MCSIKLKIKTGNQQYPIHIGSNVLNKIQKLLKENLINYNQCLIVADKNVPKKLIKKTFSFLPKKRTTLHYFNASEKNKNQKSIDKILLILF